MGIVPALWRTAAHWLVVEVLLNRKLLSRIERTSTDMRVSYRTLVLLFLAGLCSLGKNFPLAFLFIMYFFVDKDVYFCVFSCKDVLHGLSYQVVQR